MQTPPDLQLVPGGDSRNKQTRVALYVIGGVVAFGCCGVIALSAILFPVFMKSKETAKSTSTLNNLKLIGLGLSLYTQDYDDKLPPAATWMDSARTHIPDSTAFRAPRGEQVDQQIGYVFNNALDMRTITTLADQSRTPLIFEGDAPLPNTTGSLESLVDRNGNAHILLSDMSARRFPIETARELDWLGR